MNKNYAQDLLKKTTQDYNRIAEQFSSSRYSIWLELNIFGEYIRERDRVLDLGCGNGRLFELFRDKEVDYIGIDNSKKLIEVAKKKYPDGKFQVADALNLPFPDNYFDKIFCIAVLHHIPSEGFRLQFLKETKRVLRPEGLLIVTVWDLWRRPKAFKLLLKFAILKISGKSKLDFKDIFVPWQKKIDRYIHCFTKNELKKLVKETDFKIKKAGIFRRGETKNYNIYIVAEK